MALRSSRFGGMKGSPTVALSPGGQAFDFDDLPSIRQDDGEHGTPDDDDNKRITWNTYLWDSQDDSVRRRDRQIEENIRMLSGQQWSVFNPRLGRFIDVTNWMTSDEKKWRQRPVFNRLLPWFIITHARMTENPPIVTFVPGPDRHDSMLASTLDVIFKKKWREINMAEVWDRAASWLIPGGTVYLQSGIDLRKGPFVQFAGDIQEDEYEDYNLTDSQRELLQENGPGETAFDDSGYPMFNDDGTPSPQEDAHVERRGDLAVSVLPPVQVRGAWGADPWHEKAWHMTRTFHTTDEIMELYGVKLEGYQVPNQGGSDTGIAERFIYGSGYFGAADPNTIGSDFSTNVVIPQPTVEVFTMWHQPASFAGMEEGPDKPGGRLLVTTREKVLHDSQRPVAYKYTSPIRRFDFVNLPGRPSGGTTPQESMNQPQRMYNRTAAGLLEHTNLSVNPIKLIDSQSGLEERQVNNRPGLGLKVNRRANVPPFEWVAPPPLSPDVYRTLEFLRQEVDELGNLEGTEGGAPTEDASGELVKELRFNSDRFLGPTMRRAAEEFSRMAEDWVAIVPTLYDEEDIISYAGADNVAQTIVVYPELFNTASVDVQADVESMLPEGRGERQKNVTALYANGLFGPPGSPEAVKNFFELSRFPHLGRAGKFGGIHKITADQENGKILQGTPAVEIPVFEWYNDMVHLMSHEEFMSAPEFLELDPQIQQQFVMHRQMHIMNIMMKAAQVAETGPDEGQAQSGGGEPPTESQSQPGGPASLPQGQEQSPTGPTL